MITSKQIISISEDWFNRGDWASKDTDIYINPTSSDYRELNKNKIKILRFIIDQPTKTVYVANAWNSVHGEIVDNINNSGISNRFYKLAPTQLAGISTMSGGKSIMSSSDFLFILLRRYNKRDKDLLEKVLRQDWTWADKYVKITDYLNTVKQTVQSKG